MDSPTQYETPIPQIPSQRIVVLKRFAAQHPTALIIGSFVLLPFIIFGIVLLGLKVKNGTPTEITPTPTISISPTTFEKPTETPEPIETLFPEKTSTPTKKPTPKLTTGPTALPTQSATATPTKQANLYFHTVDCSFIPTASGSASTNLNNATIASANVPDTAQCHVIFQNGEDTESGEIWYRIGSESQKSERAVGTLKKGNYPSGDFKEYTEVVSLNKAVGAHELKFELNYAKLFPETTYDDNSKSVKYTVQ